VVDARRGLVRAGDADLLVAADAYWEHIDRVVAGDLRRSLGVYESDAEGPPHGAEVTS
jgi:hypothetical protein